MGSGMYEWMQVSKMAKGIGSPRVGVTGSGETLSMDAGDSAQVLF